MKRFLLLLVIFLYSTVTVVLGGDSKYEIQNLNHSNSNILINSIPVVIYVSSQSNINNSDLISKFVAINNFLAADNTCDSNYDSPSTEISLCLAERDVFGKTSDGIISLSSSYSSLNACTDEISLKMEPRLLEDRYPTTDYLNIYLVDDICASCEPFGCAASGFSTFPADHGTIRDGIVLTISQWLGDCDDTKTIIHELGHYLGLLHTFEGGCQNDNCTDQGDKVCDTPPQFLDLISSTHPCQSNADINSCISDNKNDPSNNIMNYVPAECMTEITPGQIARMQSQLCNQRLSLMHSKGCSIPCELEIDVQLFIPEIVYVNEEYTIINNSLNANGFSWSIDNAEVSTLSDFNYTFLTEGDYDISLTMNSDFDECTRDTIISVTAICLDLPQINVSNNELELGDVIDLEVLNTDLLLNYTWYIGDSIIGTGVQITFEANITGVYNLYLQACNNQCCRYSTLQHIVIGECLSLNQGNKWIIGIDGVVVDFVTGNPVVTELLAEEFVIDNFNGIETTLIQTNDIGEILFYSDNFRIYNRDNEMITTSNYLGPSSCQSVCVRQPKHPNKYFVFRPEQLTSSDPVADSLKTLSYCVIDMALNNGLGGLTTENELLLEFATEKITAIQHCNGSDWWIVTHEAGSNKYLSYLLTEEGLDHNPIVSAIGTHIGFGFEKAGFLKFSHDGKYLASSGLIYDTLTSATFKGYLDIFEFDNSSGSISNRILVDSTLTCPYGIEFSSNNDYLYITDGGCVDTDPSVGDAIFQYQTNIIDQDLFLSSRTRIEDPNLENGIGALQIGMDNKIYCSSFTTDTYLHVIDQPNRKAPECNLRVEGFDLNNDSKHIGLPNFPARFQRIEYPEIDGERNIDLCSDSLLTYQSFGRCSVEDYHWTLLGENMLLSNVGDSVQILFNTISNDTLLLERTTACDSYIDTMFLNVMDCNFECEIEFNWINVDTLICLGENPILHYSTNALQVNVNGSEQDINTNRIILDEPQRDTCIQIELIQSYLCDTSFQICITVDQPLQIENFDPLVSICSDEEIYLDFTTDADIIEVFDINYDTTITISTLPISLPPVESDTSFFLRLARYEGNCNSYFEILVEIDESISIGNQDTSLCFGESITILDSLLVDEGSYELITTTTRGCDSLLIFELNFHPQVIPDTTYNSTCIVSEIDTQFISNINDLGCEYQDVIITLFEPTDTTYTEVEHLCEGPLPESDTLVLLNSIGCDSVVISRYEMSIPNSPIINTVEQEYIFGNMIELTLTNFNQEEEYNWYSFGELVCENCISYSFEAIESITLEIEAINSYDCISNYSVDIIVIKETEVIVPNIFSPNGDGVNDILFIGGYLEEGTSILDVSIFDRWGNIIHQNTNVLLYDQSNGWNGSYNGRAVQPGVYICLIRLIDEIGKEKVIVKDVTVVR